MKKAEILDCVYTAIEEVSPLASEILRRDDGSRKEDVYLVDLGVNSIDYAHVAHIVMGELNIDSPLDVFAQTNKVSEVVDILYDLAKDNGKEAFALGTIGGDSFAPTGASL